MSSLPLGFLAPWQPKHDSLRMGATSLMKLTAPLAAGGRGGGVAGAGGGRGDAGGRRQGEGEEGGGGREGGAEDAEAGARWGHDEQNPGGQRGGAKGSRGWGAAGGCGQQRPLYDG